MSEERPRLRNLEAFPVEQDGRRLMALRDPSGFTDQVVALPMPLLDVVSLLETMAASGRKTCLIAGVDLAHVGPRFGDPETNTDESLAAVAAADRCMLEAVVAGEPTSFYASVAHDGDRRRICGLSPIYTFLRALPGVRGRLIRYSQWPDPEAAVTFCAAAFP